VIRPGCDKANSRLFPGSTDYFPGSAVKIPGSAPREFSRDRLILLSLFCGAPADFQKFPVLFPTNGKLPMM
jgi:hypothetical protein